MYHHKSIMEEGRGGLWTTWDLTILYTNTYLPYLSHFLTFAAPMFCPAFSASIDDSHYSSPEPHSPVSMFSTASLLLCDALM